MSLSPPLGEPSLVARLRSVHREMVEAVLGGDGLGRVASLAAAQTSGTVAITVARLGVAVCSDGSDIGELRAFGLGEQDAAQPPGVIAHVPIVTAGELLGAVMLLARPDCQSALSGGLTTAEVTEFLHLAAVAALTEIAVQEARFEVEENLHGSFLEDLRTRAAQLDGDEVSRRAARLGCDLSRGAVVLCAELSTQRPRHVVALIAESHPGALAQQLELPGAAPRVCALLPARGGDDAAETTVAAARALAARLDRHGTVGLSSFCTDPTELGRALREAELVLDVLRRTGAPITEDLGSATYRLLFRVLASHPEEVRSFYDDTVAPIVRYDDRYTTDLIGTLEAYLGHDCNMNATAAAIYAHRHTVAYRLERIRELSGLDPTQSEDRERLGLGLKAYRIIAPRLPR